MISVFDMFSVGIGLLSLYIVGLMKVGVEFVIEFVWEVVFFDLVDSVKVELFGLLG